MACKWMHDHESERQCRTVELSAAVATGKMKFKETVSDGLATAPQAFMGLLSGKNLGKQLVKLV
jgi:NADPH-dependent curcumin reductase